MLLPEGGNCPCPALSQPPPLTWLLPSPKFASCCPQPDQYLLTPLDLMLTLAPTPPFCSLLQTLTSAVPQYWKCFPVTGPYHEESPLRAGRSCLSQLYHCLLCTLVPNAKQALKKNLLIEKNISEKTILCTCPSLATSHLCQSWDKRVA